MPPHLVRGSVQTLEVVRDRLVIGALRKEEVGIVGLDGSSPRWLVHHQVAPLGHDRLLERLDSLEQAHDLLWRLLVSDGDSAPPEPRREVLGDAGDLAVVVARGASGLGHRSSPEFVDESAEQRRTTFVRRVRGGER
jgi:hypothetical protein